MMARYLSALGVLAAAACGERNTSARAAERAAERAPMAAAGEARPTVVFLGTSLTAGYGLDPEQAYPALIQSKIDSAGLNYRVMNAGVSGQTSAGTRRQAEWILRQPVAVLVVETGANDALRGLPVDSLRANMQAILDRARALRPPPDIVLVGMLAPPNLGSSYTRRFGAVYPELAKTNGVPLVPFLLEGVAGIDSLNQADAIHPTAAGQRRMAETVWRVLEPVLRARAATAASRPARPARSP